LCIEAQHGKIATSKRRFVIGKDGMVKDLLQHAARYFAEQQQQAYLVGGSVRDLLLQKACTDWDIAATGDVPALARRLANSLHGYFAHMHDKASRVIVKVPEHDITIDISPLYHGNIEEDLRERDFTINAIALSLDNAVAYLSGKDTLIPIDPLQGAPDLAQRRLRAVNEKVFQRDPLRMLRAFRFMMLYQLTLDEHTAQMLTRDASLLLQAAPERTHDELYALLRPPGATERLRQLDQYGLFMTLMPEFARARGMPQPALHYWDVFDHSLQTVAALEQLADELYKSPEELRRSPFDLTGEGSIAELQTLLHEAEQQRIFQWDALVKPVMKLAALLHDIGKPITYSVDNEERIRFYNHPQAGVPLAQDIMQRISASTHDRRLVQQVVAHHMRPGQLSGDEVTTRAIRRFFVDLGPTGIYVALVSLCDHLAMRGPLPLNERWTRHLSTVLLLLHKYIRERQHITPPRLLQGNELMHRLKLEPGPIVGQLLEYIAEAQAEGTIHSKEEALWFAQDKLQQLESSSR
jgi:poly(A) polymerase